MRQNAMNQKSHFAIAFLSLFAHLSSLLDRLSPAPPFAFPALTTVLLLIKFSRFRLFQPPRLHLD
jgi:hypothetical protein